MSRGSGRAAATPVVAVALAAGLAVGLAAGPAWAGGDVAAGRAKASRCSTCHGLDGIGRLPNVPHIAGESEIYLAKQLKAFRGGTRVDPVMSVVAASLSDQDIADLVAYYSAIEITVRVPE